MKIRDFVAEIFQNNFDFPNTLIFNVFPYIVSFAPQKSFKVDKYIHQSPENVQFFLGTTRTFKKLPTFSGVSFFHFSFFWVEWMYILFHNYLFGIFA